MRTSRPNSLLSAYPHALDQFNAANRKKEKARFEVKPSSDTFKSLVKLQSVPLRSSGWNPNTPHYPNNNISNRRPGYFPIVNPRAPYPSNNYNRNSNNQPHVQHQNINQNSYETTTSHQTRTSLRL